MKCLVLGRNGQLATHLHTLLPEAIFLGSKELDLNDSSALAAEIEKISPTHIVNAAAYTAVDKAESEPEQAWAVNAVAPGEAARAARRLGIPMIHISSDYVFDGTSSRAYRPEDATGPTGVYAKTKLAGELAVTSLCERHWVLRTSWVFSEHGSNFVRTMLRLARERDALSIVADQHGVPTYAGDLARVVAALVSGTTNTVAWGTYHAVGGPPTTWFDFARVIFETAAAEGVIGKVPKLSAITTAEYPTAARRPANSILEPSPALFEHNAKMDWEQGLRQTLRALKSG
jgi:dTDP-4-dehydrorhamnose reductase